MTYKQIPKEYSSIIDNIVDDIIVTVRDNDHKLVRLHSGDLRTLREIGSRLVEKIVKINNKSLTIKTRDLKNNNLEKITHYNYKLFIGEVDGHKKIEEVFSDGIIKDKKNFLVLLDPENQFKSSQREYSVQVSYFLS